MICVDCGGKNLAHDDAGSLACTHCGTLADPSRPVLVDHQDHPSASSYVQPWRTSRGWSQTKQDRDRKNTIAINTFIASVLARLNSPGLSPRAEAIFSQAMRRGSFRWGRKARRVAGAAIAVALREAHKSDSLRDIAYFLDDSPVSLARAFQSVLSLLDFSFAPTDPAVHLPVLLAHLRAIIHPETSSPPSHLPDPLRAVLSPLSLQAAVHTATSLSHIVSHHDPPLPINALPTPPTACALFILGLEAEARAPLPHLKDLSRALATRFALAPGVVASRYKTLYDLVEQWIRHVPWLHQFQPKGPSARSKVSKRAVVAKGLEDVVQFHQQIWSSRMQSQRKLNLDIERDPGDEEEEEEDHDDDDDDDTADVSTIASSSKRAVASPPAKRRKIDDEGDAIRSAYRLLFDPSSSSRARDAETLSRDVSLLTHMLTCSPDQLSRLRGGTTPLTRLQLLAAFRGGSTQRDIADEELFADGELEGFFRNEQEREALLPLFQLNWMDDKSTEEVALPGKPAVAEETTKRGAKRVDMDALARVLGTHVGADSSGEEDAVFPHPGDIDAYQWGSSAHQKVAEGADDWRSVSPGDDGDIFGELAHTVEDRYEEEL